jgi:type IX secretion system PorP/SprF family membrane protein
MKKKIILSFVSFASFAISVAQDIHFSQFNFAPINLNPAQAGVQNDLRAVANYRNQWSSIGNGYKTMGVAADGNIFKKPGRAAYLGLGLSIYNDKAGDGQMSTFMTHASVSGVVPMEKSIFSAGLQFGYNQKSINTDNLQWESQFNGFKYDPTLPTYEYFTNPSFNFFDVGAGVNWYYSKTEAYMTANDELKANVGLSVSHFNGPRQSFKDRTNEKLYSKIIFHGNFSIGLKNTSICLVPSYVVYFQGPNKQINVGNLFKYIITEASHYTHLKKPCAVSVGGFYRVGDAVIAQAMFEYDRYALGFAYDLNTSKLKTASKSFGGFEINFLYRAFRAVGTKSRI